MNKTVIRAEVVAHSLSPQGDELVSLSITFPRIILAEINTHRMLSKNTSSSRAIPFKKMVEAVKNDPFIPIAWQKPHSGMQGNEYYNHTLTEKVGGLDYTNLPRRWLRARDTAVSMAKIMTDERGNMPVTKQLANRLLEPFMWTTMLITGSKEGWNNFFRLRCPQYEHPYNNKRFKSKKEFNKYDAAVLEDTDDTNLGYNAETKEHWYIVNKGQAEIHMMDLAEKIYDAVNESIPKQLKVGEWHIPYEDRISSDVEKWSDDIDIQTALWGEDLTLLKVKVSTAMAARESYTVIGNEKNIDYQKQIELHDRLIVQDPPHSSCLEHCNRAMTDEEHASFRRGFHDVERMDNGENQYWFIDDDSGEAGWCNNIKGFIPYRYMIDNNLKM